MKYILFHFVCYMTIKLVYQWNLQDLEKINKDFYISSIAIYRNRAFLALSRSICYNGINEPTLIEVPWKSGDIFSSMNNWNYLRDKILEHQIWGQCENIQDAVSVDIEYKRASLWILDKGSTSCNPKIISYNLLYNIISEKIDLKNIARQNLNVITIDQTSGIYGNRAYIGNSGINTLLVLSLKELKLWKLKLSDPNYPNLSVKPDILALSKTDSQLFITSKSDFGLFSLDLKDINKLEETAFSRQKNITAETTVTYVGDKLGQTSALETDYKSGLSYYMVNDYAIVRWTVGLPMKAEYHSVLAQSYERLPYVSLLFTDPQNGLWALINPLNPSDCQQYMENVSLLEIPEIETRFVKILRYNKYVKEMEVDEIV